MESNTTESVAGSTGEGTIQKQEPVVYDAAHVTVPDWIGSMYNTEK